MTAIKSQAPDASTHPPVGFTDQVPHSSTDAAPRTRRNAPAIAAYAAAAGFALGLSRFVLGPQTGAGSALADGTPLGALLAAIPHVLLLCWVLPAWPATILARLGGLWWLVLDLCSSLLAGSGAQPTMFLGVRFIGHLGAAAWLIGGSWPRGGALRWVGLVTGLWLAAYTVVSPWVPPVALAPTAPLLIAWCVLVGRDLSTHRG